MFSKIWTKKSMSGYLDDRIQKLKKALADADSVVIGAGAGLSTSAGFEYLGERFRKYFSDFEEKYGFHDMYSGGFYPYDSLEEYWAFWSRYIYINRYMDAPQKVYESLYDLVKEKDYFVLTTNVDHCFQKAGFDKHRLFYTQGDYGLFQCMEPCYKTTYDNKEAVRKMLHAQGYSFEKEGELYLPEGVSPKRKIPSELVPYCSVCGKPMTMNLRCDDTFVEDEGWHRAALRYDDFLRRHKKERIMFLELGVGYNTPGIIKYPFWQMTLENPQAVYACVNSKEAFAPEEIQRQTICIANDIKEVLTMMCRK
ncbi:MAG: Sir2 silent information regulator family NAD-dependent deacetylase [Lachnospiraceae bacterium]